MTESGLLAGGAGGAAILLSSIASPFLARQLGASSFPSWLDAGADWRVAVLMAVAGFVTTLILGVVPALRVSGIRPDQALKSGSKQSGRTGLLLPLIPIQVAFSFMVLFLGVLFLISFNKLIHVDPGFSKDHLVLFTVNTKALTTEQQRAAITHLLANSVVSRASGPSPFHSRLRLAACSAIS